MTIQRRSKTNRQVLGAAAVVLSASMTLAFTPTKASAFDIGGLIGTAMALQMGHYHSGYSGGRSRTHVASRDSSSHDSDSSGRGNTTVERDARDPVTATVMPPGNSDNRGAGHMQKTQGPSSLSGGIAQASVRDVSVREAAVRDVPERDAAADDPPAFNPSR